MTPAELADIAERAQHWELVKIDSSRWGIEGEGGKWAPMPRVVGHAQLGHDVTYGARFAPRRVAQEALECYRRGELPPIYRQTGHGLERVQETV